VPWLGLVIIDEEQRFGVEHKEYLKRLRTEVDVLFRLVARARAAGLDPEMELRAAARREFVYAWERS